MAFEYTGLSYTAEASADLSADQYKAVQIDVNGRIALEAAALAIAGVLQNNPDALGQAASVKHAGVTKAVLGATVAAGAEVEVNASISLSEGGDVVAEFATAMKTLHDAESEAYAKIESVLTKALDTVSKGDALKEVGSDGEPVATDASAKLAKAADKLIEADSNLTREAAIAKAIDNDNSLYEG